MYFCIEINFKTVQKSVIKVLTYHSLSDIIISERGKI
nr:MAG TPA: hypothetical protein [Caudoviricetes sp.]